MFVFVFLWLCSLIDGSGVVVEEKDEELSRVLGGFFFFSETWGSQGSRPSVGEKKRSGNRFLLNIRIQSGWECRQWKSRSGYADFRRGSNSRVKDVYPFDEARWSAECSPEVQDPSGSAWRISVG